jgi:DNA-binding Xre family transcriptional regulator
MKVEIDTLQDLMRLRKVTVAKLSEGTGISEDTIRRRMKDKDWRMSEVDKLVKVLDIPKNCVYVIFFEPVLEANSSEVTE